MFVIPSLYFAQSVGRFVIDAEPIVEKTHGKTVTTTRIDSLNKLNDATWAEEGEWIGKYSMMTGMSAVGKVIYCWNDPHTRSKYPTRYFDILVYEISTDAFQSNNVKNLQVGQVLSNVSLGSTCLVRKKDSEYVDQDADVNVEQKKLLVQLEQELDKKLEELQRTKRLKIEKIKERKSQTRKRKRTDSVSNGLAPKSERSE